MRPERASGALVAAILAGAWRESAFPQLEITPHQLAQATPLLQYSGAAGLAWWRLRDTSLRNTPSAAELRETYRFQALRCALYEQKIQKLFRVFRQTSVPVILAKGWGAARLYPNTAVRPYGDIDIVVRSEHCARAIELLRSPELSDCECDLHQASFTDLPELSFDELWANIETTELDGEPIAILGREHHLRLLCLHFARHSAWRSLWLCDVAVALESLPDDFDWEVSMGSDKLRARWMVYVIQLARDLLGAKPRSMPDTVKAQVAPAWLRSWVLKQWANLGSNPTHSPSLIPMLRFLRQPRGLWDDIRGRWPNPIVATMELNAIPNSLPRLPYQLAIVLPRAGRFLVRACTGQAKR